jgi:hypothetical protein
VCASGYGSYDCAATVAGGGAGNCLIGSSLATHNQQHRNESFSVTVHLVASLMVKRSSSAQRMDTRANCAMIRDKSLSIPAGWRAASIALNSRVSSMQSELCHPSQRSSSRPRRLQDRNGRPAHKRRGRAQVSRRYLHSRCCQATTNVATTKSTGGIWALLLIRDTRYWRMSNACSRPIISITGPTAFVHRRYRHSAVLWTSTT